MFEKILNNYDIKVKKITKLNKGYAANKWIVVAVSNHKYVLKEITKQNKERLNFILNIQNKISNLAPTVKKCKNNNLFCDYNGKLYYMMEFIETNESTKVDDSYYELGQFLAILHMRLNNIKDIEKMEFLKIENNKSQLVDLLKFYEDIDNKKYRKIIEYKLNVLQYTEQNKINFDSLSYQIVHGDFYIDNILFCNYKYKILDFDQTCFFYREYEVLRGMFMICLNFSLSKEEVFSNMKKFIKGYMSNNRIASPSDAYNLYLYVQTNSLSGIKKNEYLDKKRLKFTVKRFNILKFLYENRDEIINILEEN